MEKRIIFCNIAWMKDYVGVRDDDKPINGGGHIKSQGTGGEVYNFLDDNGKCHGFVRVGGNMALEKHFKGVSAKDKYVDNVLVVWLATNKNKQTRIVGWYENARVYRSDRDLSFFVDYQFSSYYNIVARAEDCYLIPEDNRTYTIDRASEVGAGMGIGQSNVWYAESAFARKNIIPEVVKYIENYKGPFGNVVYIENVIEEEISKLGSENPKDLYKRGLELFEVGDYYSSDIYFKACYKRDKSIEVLDKLAKSLHYSLRYDEGIEMLKKLIDLKGETFQLLYLLMKSYDFIRNREKTIEYAKKLINFPTEDKKEIKVKASIYIVLFDIYLYGKKYDKSERVIEVYEVFLRETLKELEDDIEAKVKELKRILNTYID